MHQNSSGILAVCKMPTTKKTRTSRYLMCRRNGKQSLDSIMHTHTHIIHARRTRRNTILTSKSGDKQIDKPTNKNKSSENLFAGRNRDNVSTHNKKQAANTNKIIRNRQQYNWTHCKSEKSTMKKKLRAEKVIEML